MTSRDMTFEEFKASGVDDLTGPGRIYCGSYWIQHNPDTVRENDGQDCWYLLLERSDWLEPFTPEGLERQERRLYEWCISEGVAVLRNPEADPSEPTNEDRAERASAIVEAYINQHGGDGDNVIRDLIADLLHYARAHGFDPIAEHASGLMHFDAEEAQAQASFDSLTREVPSYNATRLTRMNMTAFATALRHYDFHHAYSDDSRIHIEGERAFKEIVRMGRALPRGEVLALYELKCRREYGDEAWWSRMFETDPVPGALADFEAALDRGAA